MVRSHEKERMKSMIKDTLMLLVKNGLSFNVQFSIEALIGITVDQDDIMLLSVNEIIQAKSQHRDGTKRSATGEASDSEEDIVCVSEEKAQQKKPRIQRSRAEMRTHKKSSRSEQSGKSASVNDKPSVGALHLHSQRNAKSPAYSVKTGGEKLFTKPLPENIRPVPHEIQLDTEKEPTTSTSDVVEVITDDLYCGVTDRSPRIKSDMAEVEIDWESFSTIKSECSLPGTESKDQSIFSSCGLTPGGANLRPGASSLQTDGIEMEGIATEKSFTKPLPEHVRPLPFESQLGSGEEATTSTLEVDVTTEDFYCGVTDCDPRIKAEVEIDWTNFSNVKSGCSLPGTESQDESIFSSSMITPGGADPRPGISSQQVDGCWKPRITSTLTESASYSPSTCNLCGKTFSRGTSYRRHKREQHSSEKQFHLCPLQNCSGKLARKSEMKIHLMKSHSILDADILQDLLSRAQITTVPRNDP